METHSHFVFDFIRKNGCKKKKQKQQTCQNVRGGENQIFATQSSHQRGSQKKKRTTYFNIFKGMHNKFFCMISLILN